MSSITIVLIAFDLKGELAFRKAKKSFVTEVIKKRGSVKVEDLSPGKLYHLLWAMRDCNKFTPGTFTEEAVIQTDTLHKEKARKAYDQYEREKKASDEFKACQSVVNLFKKTDREYSEPERAVFYGIMAKLSRR